MMLPVLICQQGTTFPFLSLYMHCCVLSAGQLSHLLGEVQYLEDQVASDAVVFRMVDCSAQPLIYNTEAVHENSELTVSDLLDSCPTRWTDDVESQLGTKKSVSSENSQVCDCC